MKGFALLVAALAGAALLYVTTAVGGQQAGPSRAEFNALKKQVATLKKDDTAIQAVLGACLTSGIPVLQYVGYEIRADDGTTFVDTALDVAAPGDTPTMYLLDIGQECAQVINTARLNLHKLKVVRPATTQR
ncbi:MAG: hypothetical protein QOE13_2864 [Gaiellaceae bacterium]|jgi:hypothetical protein|nr:hypothetical protein [Gaiellaceae bacterium]